MMGGRAVITGFRSWLLSFSLLAAYACGTYGAGAYGTCDSVGAPNTGFALFDVLKSTLTSPYVIIGLVLVVLGGVAIALAARRRRQRK